MFSLNLAYNDAWLQLYASLWCFNSFAVAVVAPAAAAFQVQGVPIDTGHKASTKTGHTRVTVESGHTYGPDRCPSMTGWKRASDTGHKAL